MGTTLLLRPMADDEIEAIVELWHTTQRDAYRYMPLQHRYTLAEHDRFFRSHILREQAIWVAAEGETLLGFLAIKGSYIDRLYVHPAHQRQGVGTALLGKAHELSPHELELETLQQNTQARAFYEKHGFCAVRFGVSQAPESAPNVTYRWTAAR